MSDADRVEEIFWAALEQTAPVNREEYLRAACAGDAALRGRVDRLLAAQRRAGGFLEAPPVSAAVVPPLHAAGQVVAGRYTLVEKVGEGGMGEVWVADQAEPIRRLVAVKFVKPDAVSPDALARFEGERQTLALMDHPNIARVLDGGFTDDPPGGHPFLVMELVKGVPITEFCDARKLTPKDRLELFVPVCQAVQHAHQKGIIHRDIKPSNVLVALYDDRPVPKVIDFGLAKAVGGSGAAATAFGMVVGTPAYMSPEQAALNNLDVDTRSDVYSLGVLLYELLTGTPPFSEDELRHAGLLELLRLVREVEPPLPSQKLASSHTRAEACVNRGTAPAALARLLRGDLDRVAAKALDKDRARRYESAGGLAADVERYLSGRPVEAHPPSRWYRLRKFVRRNRPATVATALVAFSFAVGAAGTVAGLVESRRQERLIRQALAEERAARAEAVRNLRSFTQAHAGLIKSVMDYEWRRQATPEAVRENLKYRLDEQVRWLNATPPADPVVRHELRAQLALAYRQLELYAAAVTQARLALTAAEEVAPEGPEVVLALLELGQALDHAGREDEGRDARARGVALGRALPPPNTDEGRRAWFLLARYLTEYGGEPDLAARCLEVVLPDARAAHGPRHPDTLRLSHQLAWARMRQGRHEEALALERETVAAATTELGPKHPQVVQMLLDAHQLMINCGRTDSILLAAVRASLGPDRVGDGLLAIEGFELLKAGRWAEAEGALRRCLAAREALRPDAWTTFNTRSLLGGALLGQRRYDEAAPLLASGFDGLKAREAAIPAEARVRLREAAERLLELARARGDAAGERKWAAVRDSYP